MALSTSTFSASKTKMNNLSSGKSESYVYAQLYLAYFHNVITVNLDLYSLPQNIDVYSQSSP